MNPKDSLDQEKALKTKNVGNKTTTANSKQPAKPITPALKSDQANRVLPKRQVNPKVVSQPTKEQKVNDNKF
jgi:hypothetical protein